MGKIRRKDPPYYDFTEQAVTSSGRVDPYAGSDEWARNGNSDVVNRRAFDRHINQVGEEDQTQPGWDGP